MSEKEKQWYGLGKILNDVGRNYVNSVIDTTKQRIADDAPLPKNQVRGGTAMVDFDARVVFNDSGHLTINAPTGEVGGDPADVLFRMLMNKHGDQITAKVGNNLLESRGDVLSGKSIGFSGEAGVVAINTSANLTPSVKGELMQNVQENFDIKFAQTVINWCESNKNGAKIEVNGTTIVYTKSMVDDLRVNAEKRYDEVAMPNRSSSAEVEPPSRSVAQTPDKASVVASATPEIQASGTQSLEFRNNPTVQQVSAALERNGIAAENQNPSLVAGLAGAAANLSKVQDVALTPQTAFALDRDKFDPAANRASVGMDVANKPFDEVWQKASVALQQTQAPAVVAQAQDLEQKQSQSAPRM
ncbi:MAG: hypothetical protein V4673_01025 [Pseudomonadota bacterium]